MGPIRVAQLDEFAKERHAEETAYLYQFLNAIDARGWDPQQFVPPTAHHRGRVPEPVPPLFIAVEATPDVAPDGTWEAQDRRERLKARTLTDLYSEVLRLCHVLLLGPPGSGKTICLLQLGLEFASRSLISGRTDPPLPVFLPLNEYTRRNDASGEPEEVLDFVRSQVVTQFGPDTGSTLARRLEALLRDGRLVLLFDAMDEMPRDDYYERFGALSRFLRAYQNNLFVFSCRINDYVDDPTFLAEHVILAPFSRRQASQFFRRYLGRRARRACLEAFRRQRTLALEAQNPFFLSLMAACARTDLPLGESWEVLLRNFTDVALDRERVARGLRHDEWRQMRANTLSWLATFAFRLTQTKATGTKADASLVERTLDETGVAPEVVDIAVGAGFLRSLASTGDVRFEHHRLQEYFAACHLAELLERDALELSTIMHDIWWEEVAVMAAGLMANPNALLEGILDEVEAGERPPSSRRAKAFATLMLAFRCYRTTRHRITPHTAEVLRVYVLQFLRRGNLLERVRTLRIAGQFDDPRVVMQVRRMLTDDSPWVRGTALTALTESTIAFPGLVKTMVWRAFAMVSGDEELMRGVRLVPALARSPRLRWVLPACLVIALLAVVKAVFVWLLASAASALLWQTHVLTTGETGFLIAFPPIVYAWWRYLMSLSRRVRLWPTFQAIGLMRSFNAFSTWTILVVAAVIGLRRSVGPWVALAILLVGWRLIERHCRPKEWGPVSLRLLRGPRLAPVPTEASAEQRRDIALERIKMAASERDTGRKLRLLDSIREMTPLDETVADALWQLATNAPELPVQEKAWQVYEEVELSLRRTSP